MKRAIILLSGGLDSATVLYYAKAKGYKPFGLILDYGQRHSAEIRHAGKIADSLPCAHQTVKVNLPWLSRGSAVRTSLVDRRMALPNRHAVDVNDIPTTYVPARNIIFLSLAMSYAESIGARAVFIGANAIDYSGYPDCRPDFFAAYQKTITTGLKTGVQGKSIRIYTPLIHKTKAQIIRMGIKLQVPYALTWSCYKGGRKPCRVCDSCLLRQKGFDEVGVNDPLQ